ncbi:MAG: hypothetical protein AAGE01_06260 [Pseudomonadota bacterium]
MSTKRPISRRELWLVSFLPAALVLIVSLGLPKGDVKNIPDMERRLAQLSTESAVQRRARDLRTLTAELTESQAQLDALSVRETALQARVDAIRSPGAGPGADMAKGLDALTKQLAGHGVQVLGMVQTGGSRTSLATNPAATRDIRVPNRPASRSSRRRAARVRSASSAALGASNVPRWQVNVAATWPAMGAILADPETFPPGLALSAMTMQPPRPSLSLRVWQLTVSDAGVSQ